MSAKCPRCSDCEGQEHHWLEDVAPNLEHDYVCKHCGAVCSMEAGVCADGPDEMARHSTSHIAAAYIRDRAAQYRNDSGSKVALEDLARSIALGEHMRAYEHGELDDLLPDIEEPDIDESAVAP